MNDEARLNIWLGWPKTGKTQAMMDFIRQHAFTHRFIVLDRANEWGLTDAKDERKPNPRWRGHPPSIVDVSHDVLTMDPFSQWQWFEEGDQPKTGIFRFAPPAPEGEDVARVVCHVGNAFYVDDEIDSMAVVAGWKNNPLRLIIHQGRHLINAAGETCEVGFLGACRRPQSLHPDVTAIADQGFIFRCQGDLTLSRLRSDAWIDDDEWDVIHSLPNLHFRHVPSGTYHRMQSAFGKTKTP